MGFINKFHVEEGCEMMKKVAARNKPVVLLIPMYHVTSLYVYNETLSTVFIHEGDQIQ